MSATQLAALAAPHSDTTIAMRNRLPGIGLDELVADIPDKATEYSEINWFDDSVWFDAYIGDFSAVFHDLDGNRECLDPDRYGASQILVQKYRNSARSASSAQASATQAAPAWRVFVRRWSAMCGAT